MSSIVQATGRSSFSRTGTLPRQFTLSIVARALFTCNGECKINTSRERVGKMEIAGSVQRRCSRESKIVYDSFNTVNRASRLARRNRFIYTNQSSKPSANVTYSSSTFSLSFAIVILTRLQTDDATSRRKEGFPLAFSGTGASGPSSSRDYSMRPGPRHVPRLP